MVIFLTRDKKAHLNDSVRQAISTDPAVAGELAEGDLPKTANTQNDSLNFDSTNALKKCLYSIRKQNDLINMSNLSAVGRIFYGIGILGMGFLTIYYADFPYMLIPSKHSWISGLAMVSYILGAMLILTGACIVFEKKIRTISLLLACFLLLIFCFYFIPYQLIVSSKFMHLGDWENAEKELALSGGAFVIAGCFSGKNENTLIRFLAKLIPFGTILFALTMISFGIDHFLYAKKAADYIPSWIPNHMFWIYFAGIPLIGSGIGIIFKIKVWLIAALLGIMIFIWFIILHIPYVIAAHFSDTGGEVTSAFLALAYSGIAFVIAGAAKKNS